MTERHRRSPWPARAGIGLAAAALCAVTSSRAQQAPPAAPADERLSRAVSIQARAADVAGVLAQLSRSVGVQMDAEGDAAEQRITLYATNTRIQSLQSALAELLHTRWRPSGDGPSPRYRLAENAALQAQAERLRLSRRATFLARLLQTEQAMRLGDPGVLAESARAGILARFPSYPQEILSDVTPDMLQQSFLLAPMRLGITRVVQQGGSAWVLLRSLPQAYQQLLIDFAARAMPANADPTVTAQDADAQALRQATLTQVLSNPQARVEYRLLFGDRWTDTVMLVRIGESDHWATALLPAILYDLPDYSVLYPQAQQRIRDPEFDRQLGVKIDTNVLSWDQALSLISRTAGINAISDSYPRPDVFRGEGPGPILTSGTLEQTLDSVASYYGYVWWHRNGWYYFRNRLWTEQNRVSVPQRLLQELGAGLARDEHLPPAALASLAALTDEQLLTLHLSGRAGGRTYAPLDAFDLNEIQLAHAGLTLFGQMTEQQRTLAQGVGLPYNLLSPMEQYLFASTARDRGILPENDDPERWRFRLTDSFYRERLPAGWAELGSVRLQFDYGGAGVRTAELALRAPAVGRTPAEPEKGAGHE